MSFGQVVGEQQRRKEKKEKVDARGSAVETGSNNMASMCHLPLDVTKAVKERLDGVYTRVLQCKINLTVVCQTMKGNMF